MSALLQRFTTATKNAGDIAGYGINSRRKSWPMGKSTSGQDMTRWVDPIRGANWISTVRRLNEAFQSSSRTTPIIRPEHGVMDNSLNLYFADSNCCRSVSTCSLCPCGPTLRYTFLITPLGSIKKVLRAARVIPLYSMIEPYFSTTV